MKVIARIVLLLGALTSHALGFCVLNTNNNRGITSCGRTFGIRYAVGGNSFLQQRPGESDLAFMKRLQKVASDPETFEKLSLAKDEAIDEAINMKINSENDANAKSGKTGVYQRAEDWDKEQQKIQSEFSWEDRVQFDGQRLGNRFNQNEILRKNLKSF